MQNAGDMIVLGHINGLFGIKGWVKVYSHTEPRDNILNYSPWYLQQGDEWVAYPLAEGKLHGKGVIARLQGCSDRDAAAALVGKTIAISRQQLPAAGQDEYYWSDLEGLRVVTEQDVVLGTVSHLLETGSNDVLVVIETASGPGSQARERLIPFIREQVIKNVDLANRIITVDWDPEF